MPQQVKVAVCPPILSMLATSNNCPATKLGAKLCKMLTSTFAEDNCFLIVLINIPNLPLATVNDILYYNWLIDGLYLSIRKLNQFLSAMDFFYPTSNSEYLKLQ